jgi:hypothetical protein
VRRCLSEPRHSLAEKSKKREPDDTIRRVRNRASRPHARTDSSKVTTELPFSFCDGRHGGYTKPHMKPIERPQDTKSKQILISFSQTATSRQSEPPSRMVSQEGTKV